MDIEEVETEAELVDESSADLTLKRLSIEDLHKQLSEAIKNEQYELAALIRDEINKR